MKKCCILALVGAITLPAAAQPLTPSITYQGELTNAGGAYTGLANVRFRIFDASLGGALLCTDTNFGVTVANGVFTTEIDCPFGVYDGDRRWVQLEIEAPPGSGFDVLSPRQELTGNAYAFLARNALSADDAGNANLLDGLNSTSFLRSNVSDTFNGPTLSVAAGSTLDVLGTLEAPRFTDGDNIAFFVDPSNTGTAANLAGSIIMQANEGVFVNNGTLTLGGANTIIELGDSSADAVTVSAGEVEFINDLTSITFPEVSGASDPMIRMFAAGVTNAERLVIAHSEVFNDWGLAYADVTDRFFFQQNAAASPALTVDLNLNRVGVLTDAPAAPLHVVGDIRGNRFVDNTNTAHFLDPANTATSLDIAGSIDMLPGESIDANGQLTIGGANLVLRLGDSTADQVVLPAKDLFMGDTVNVSDGDQNIYFTDGGDATSSYIRWDDVALISGCDFGAIDSAFIWNIGDGSSSGWFFANGTDNEFRVDEVGNVQADGAFVTNNSCDLAETFLGPTDLAAGTVVVLDRLTREGVVASDAAYQSGIVGVVSTYPGMLLSGPTADAYPLHEELRRVRDRLMLTDAERAELQQIELQLRNESTAENARAALEMRQAEIQQRDPALKQLRDQLESQLEGWTRGNVKVALVGRVPVRVTGPVQAGDYLTTSNIPGVAMAMTQPGPSIGIALEDFDGVGEGKVVTVIQPGYHAPQGAALASAPAQPAADVALLDATIIAQQEQIDQLSVENAELRDRLLQLEAAVDVLLQH